VRGWASIAAALVVALTGTVATFAALSPQEQDGKGETGYVGSEACSACHEELATQWRKLPHSRLLLDQRLPPAKLGCEACHGPGKKHADSGDPEAIVNPKNLAGKDRDNACLECHETKIAKIGWRQTPHYQTGLACYDCHDPHKGKPEGMLTKSIKDLCTDCHADTVARFRMNSHHPLNEGRIACTSCHDIHSGKNQSMTRAGGNLLCLECHDDKAGPFVYEHEAVSQGFSESCSECHTPHGSPNQKLLLISGRGLCYRCHSGFGSHHPGLICYDCHRAVHGSMTDEHLRR
jgi:DmsE family decaheme c-type cytochrome